MSQPTISDLDVRLKESDDLLDCYEVSSWLTRGHCASVYVSRSDPRRMHASPFLVPSYMQGITTMLICEAVTAFRERQQATSAQAEAA